MLALTQPEADAVRRDELEWAIPRCSRLVHLCTVLCACSTRRRQYLSSAIAKIEQCVHTKINEKDEEDEAGSELQSVWTTRVCRAFFARMNLVQRYAVCRCLRADHPWMWRSALSLQSAPLLNWHASPALRCWCMPWPSAGW